MPTAPNADTDADSAVLERAWAVLEAVPDPEIPVVSIRELGILRDIRRAADDTLEIVITPKTNEVTRVTLDPVGSEEMSRIWALFPTVNYRTSVVYLVTPVWIDPAQPPVNAPPVVQEDLAVGHFGD